MTARKRPRSTRSPSARTRAKPPRDPIARLRAYCLTFPGATEKLSHGEPTWFAGKVFAMLDNHHHDSEHVAVWLPAPLGVQETLVESAPERFFRPPYVGHKGWVAAILDGDPDWAVVEELVEQAYRMVAPKKLVAELDRLRSASR